MHVQADFAYMVRVRLQQAALLILFVPALCFAAAVQSFEGRLESLVTDSFSAAPQNVYLLHVKNSPAVYELAPTGVNMSAFLDGDEVRVSGELSGNRITVNAANPAHGIMLLNRIVSALSYGVPQTRRAGVLIAQSNDQAAPATVTQMRGIMWEGTRSVAGWYSEAANAQIELPPDTDGDAQGLADVFGPYHIDYNVAGACNTYTWRAAVISAAQAAGINTAQYQHLLVLLPRGSSCGYAGIASTSCSTQCAVTVYGEYWNLHDVWTHELGHNFGLGHAGYDENNDGYLDDHGILSQYMDHSCIMGEGGVGFRHFNGAHKAEREWLPQDRFLTITESGRFKIAAIELDPESLPSDQVQLVRFAYPGKSGAYFYLSYRARLGNYSVNLEDKYRNKVNVHWKGTSSLTYFITGLADGELFQDPSASICVRQLDHSETENFATVDVNFGCQDATSPAAPGALRILSQ